MSWRLKMIVAEQAKRITVDRFIVIQYVSTIYSMAGWLDSGTSSQFTQPKKMLGDVRLRKNRFKQQNKRGKRIKKKRKLLIAYENAISKTTIAKK